MASCLVSGLAHGAKVEPEAAEELLFAIVVREGSSIAEAFEEGAREEPGWYKSRPCLLLRRDLALHLQLLSVRADDGSASLAAELLRDLDPSTRPERPTRHGVEEALNAFASTGARRAFELAQRVANVARERVAVLERTPGEPSSEERRTVFALLRDLDISLLESATLPNLLALDRRPAEAGVSAPAFEELNDCLCQLFVGWEASPLTNGEKPAHPSVRLRTLRALIHLLDVDAEEGGESGQRATAVQRRWLSASYTVLRRLVADPPSVFRRSLAAALARALEGLVRAEICDPVDVLLFVGHRLADPDHFRILGEAARAPDLIALLQHYEAFVRADLAAKEPDPAAERPPAGADEATLSLSPPPEAARSQRRAVQKARRADPARPRSLGRELQSRRGAARGSGAPRARAVADSEGRFARRFGATRSGCRLGSGVVRRGSGVARTARDVGAHAVVGARGGRRETRNAAPSRFQAGALGARWIARSPARSRRSRSRWRSSTQFWPIAPAPGGFVHRDGARAPGRISRAPAARCRRAAGEHAAFVDSCAPNAWVASSCCARSAKAGVGSVFVAKRIEERNDPNAESFALKVPEFDAQVARHMSEADFLQMFQSEASALLSLPSHQNLARFVTFDSGLAPKPILVMELVDG